MLSNKEDGERERIENEWKVKNMNMEKLLYYIGMMWKITKDKNLIFLWNVGKITVLFE